MSETEFKNNGKTGLVKETSGQPSIQAVGSLLLMAFPQLHREGDQKWSGDVESVRLTKRRSMNINDGDEADEAMEAAIADQDWLHSWKASGSLYSANWKQESTQQGSSL